VCSLVEEKGRVYCFGKEKRWMGIVINPKGIVGFRVNIHPNQKGPP